MPKFNKDLIFSEDIIIHCKTENECIALCKWAHSEGLTWSDGDSYLNFDAFIEHKENTCLNISGRSYNDVKYYNGSSRYKILKYKQIIIKE